MRVLNSHPSEATVAATGVVELIPTEWTRDRESLGFGCGESKHRVMFYRHRARHAGRTGAGGAADLLEERLESSQAA